MQLKCCGIASFKDWQNTTGTHFNFPPNFNKPEGCCVWGRDNEKLTDAEIKVKKQNFVKLVLNYCVKVCRADNPTDDGTNSGFYFKGCYTSFKYKITNNQNLVLWIAIVILAVIILNLFFSFGLYIHMTVPVEY